MLSTTASALKAIRRLGYLNEFSSMGDTWFVAHSVAGGDSEDAEQIAPSVAYQLIDGHQIVRSGDAPEVLGGAGTRIAWYRPQS